MNWTGGQRNKSIAHHNHNPNSKILDLKKQALLSSKLTCTGSSSSSKVCSGGSCHGDHSNNVNKDESGSRAPVYTFLLSRNVDEYKKLQQKRQEERSGSLDVYGHHNKKA